MFLFFMKIQFEEITFYLPDILGVFAQSTVSVLDQYRQYQPEFTSIGSERKLEVSNITISHI